MPHLPFANQAPKRAMALDFEGGVDRKQLKQIKQRFMALNEARLVRAKGAMSARQCDVLALLPLLYQVNHPLLPGFVDRGAPRGLANYEPDKATIQIAKSFSQTFRYRNDRRHQPEILSLFMMGSTGTLAHSEASDVDLWLCHDEHLDEQACKRLQQKAAQIDAWANAQGLELHTFLMNPKAFREQREASAVDAESSGSSQHYLLLDEFYRTAILLAGCYPLWWLIPPALEPEYAHYTQLLLTKRFVPERDVIDFGSVAQIPKNELLGAGLWQLYKSLDAPYKSVLKLLLIEVYAQELPARPCLSLSFKQAVYDDERDLEQLDPYYLVFQRLQRYLNEQRDLKRLQLVRKSFYLKVAQPLSSLRGGAPHNWQQRFMLHLVATWAWPERAFERLDRRSQWRLERVRQERRQILNELNHSYRFLSNYARSHNIDSSITKRDLALLGRKLYARFKHKAGKIDVLNLGIAPDIWEERLAFEHSSSASYVGEHSGWLLYRRAVQPDDDFSERTQLAKSAALIELLAWAHRNGMVNKQTRLALQAGASGLQMQELRALLAALARSLPMPLAKLPQHHFEAPAEVNKLVLFINVGIDSLARLSAEGSVRVSERNDSLVYSSQRYNLVKTIDTLSLNTWNELSVGRYELGETLMQCLQNYLLMLLAQGLQQHCELDVYCFSSARADMISARVRTLFEDLRAALFEDGRQRPARYLLEVEASYYIVEALDQQFRYQCFAERSAAMRYLGQAQTDYVPLLLDRFAMTEDALLRAALAQHEAGQLQVCLWPRSEHIELCMLDEHGAVLQAQMPSQPLEALLGMLDELVSSAREHLQLLPLAQGAKSWPKVSYWQAHTSADGLQLAPAPAPMQIARYGVSANQCLRINGVWQFDLQFEGARFGAELGVEKQFQALLRQVQQQADYDDRLPLALVAVGFESTQPERPEATAFSPQRAILSYLSCFCEIQAGLNALMRAQG